MILWAFIQLQRTIYFHLMLPSLSVLAWVSKKASKLSCSFHWPTPYSFSRYFSTPWQFFASAQEQFDFCQVSPHFPSQLSLSSRHSFCCEAGQSTIQLKLNWQSWYSTRESWFSSTACSSAFCPESRVRFRLPIRCSEDLSSSRPWYRLAFPWKNQKVYSYCYLYLYVNKIC